MIIMADYDIILFTYDFCIEACRNNEKEMCCLKRQYAYDYEHIFCK